ncbi:DUF4922 domain-containing protein [Natronoflexus pectinivorans]|uniref:ATP adenylyltransferase/5',5'''-P-1,P-4-tetraphosphate phosphorylase II n=1 Tax=Natronoflexus pectinivorans TaxID=682526 RepID=A0A4R2GMT9_9BACT|nr:DUF4922 domain-containing protein [Natronoflexus pectinivorans]TCO08923.1 ATP adenylyltransferase/5',5'''-P-1,P-4-tetraphosphate phosphorylase II [Natronoflexus pectinivorans]
MGLAFNSIDELFATQLKNWDLAARNYDGLNGVLTREVEFEEGFSFKIQFNPERIRSSAAKVDADSIRKRSCFLCAENRPAEQKGISFNQNYQILLNPFPIFHRHLTIVDNSHREQLISGRYRDMLRLSDELRDFVVFYNGPRCGASAPDHFHFQAGNRGFMPVEKDIYQTNKQILASTEGCSLFAMDNYLRKALLFTGSDLNALEACFSSVFSVLEDFIPSVPEPMMNVLVDKEGEEWRVVIFPRKNHRPAQFFATGYDQLLLSPASVDFGGVLITPRKEDFEKLDNSLIRNIFKQVTVDDDVWNEIKERLVSS